ncbi:MAG TPA: argininosuccinate synthase [bacterium]|nr:argininosuccinate synthase [bacterium]HNT66514.1 argininosuccinate synthase [bacterium]HOX85564.1 argininosuccinate synthase [bacterium]HPG44723.1 argininosuccinate synthase [bacterium]HPM99105.1 argininosuccinate synthase [bacterium]
MKQTVEKVVLAYSGGLDTSIIIPWLKENYGCEVIAFAADLGQGQELDGLEEKAIKTGASKCYIEDLRKPFVEEYIWPVLKAGAIYEKRYLLGTSFARPLIAKRQVEIAEAEGADAVAHGCTGKGNDQVRFELTYKAFNPKIKVIAPWREWSIRSREDAIAYAQERNIPISASKEKIYSNDRNLWHISHEGGDLENPWNEPHDKMYVMTRSPEEAPDHATYVEIEFKSGSPVAVDGERMEAVPLLQKLNAVAGENGIGRTDLVENRLVGMKSRGVYETPGGTLLFLAHQELESLVLDRDTLHLKEMLAVRYAELVYNGQWFTPLREALDTFIEHTQQNMSGTVRLKLYKGNCQTAGRKSPYSLYREELATFGKEDIYDQTDAKGFINLFGLPLKVRALVEMEWGHKPRYREPDYSKFKRD